MVNRLDASFMVVTSLVFRGQEGEHNTCTAYVSVVTVDKQVPYFD
jgi:hypothetical protein